MDDLLALNCRALLFDLDGTLIESTARIDRLWQWWAARHGLAFEKFTGLMHGRPAAETIRLVAPHLDPQQELEALETEEISDMHDVHLYPGALELLGRLDGAPWAVVTSGSRHVAEARLAYVGLPHPPVLITADEVPRGKPAPDGYLLAAEHLAISPAQCVVIEDSPVGVEAGKAAGMRLLAVAATHSAESLSAADALVSRLTDIDLFVNGSEITLRLTR